MIVHQAYFGEVKKSHSCIHSSITDNDLKSFLIGFTDRPGQIPIGINLTPYISGTLFSNYYIFTKTYLDTNSTRLGMVFTHALILNIEDINLLKNLNDIFSLFVSKIPENIVAPAPLVIHKLNDFNTTDTRMFPEYIQQTVATLLRGKTPVIFYKNLNSFKETLTHLWNGMNFELKKQFKFRGSFTPNDIASNDNLQIVYVQEGLISKWNSYKVIESTANELVKVDSHSEQLLLGQTIDNPFVDFIKDLEVNMSQIQVLITCEKAFSIYKAIKNVNSDLVVQLIRFLILLSPNPKSGEFIKKEVIERLGFLIIKGKHSNIKSLRNLDLKSFRGGEKFISEKIYQYVISVFESDKLFNAKKVSEWIDLVATEEEVYWHIIMSKALSESFASNKKVNIENVWKVINTYEYSKINHVFHYITNDIEYESELRKYFPKQIDKSIAIELTKIAKTRKWFLLHADSIMIYQSLSDSLLSQIELEKELKYKDSIGVNYICEKLNNKKLIELTLSTQESKLVHFSGQKLISDTSMYSNIDLSNVTWLNIWAISLEKTKDIEFENVITTSSDIDIIFDHLISGSDIPNIIIKLISESKYANLYGNDNLETILDGLPIKFKESFIESTLFGYIDALLLNNGDQILDAKYHSKITSATFFLKVLAKYSNNIEVIILMFTKFNSLNESYLVDYTNQYKGQITLDQAKILGTLVKSRGFRQVAYSIINKIGINQNWKYALNECYALLDFLTRARLRVFGNLKTDSINSIEWWENIEGVIVELYPNMTAITTIWRKAGGEEFEIPLGGSPSQIWNNLIFRLKSKNIRRVTMNDLLIEINKEYGVYNERFKVLFNLKDSFLNKN